jgi:transcriptional regulator with XRE-family HTH domain
MVKANRRMPKLKNYGGSLTHQRMLTPKQLRAARALVGWTRSTLAKHSGVAVPTITGFELQGADSKISTLHKLRRALEASGVEFIDDGDASQAGGGPGVRLKPTKNQR